MSVVINTNRAAAIAANNLAYSSMQLQKSLNRLSSGSKIVNPSDDAGGLAVAMKLTAAANREGDLQNNISDANSYAQTQDGALQVAGSILDRISQLKTLSSDSTKNSSDLANYNDEFTQLQSELTSLGSQTFNGVNLFGTESLTVAVTDDLSTTAAVSVAQQNLLGSTGTGGFSTFTEDWANLSNWSVNNAGSGMSSVASGGKLNMSGSLGNTTDTSTASYSGPFQLSTTFNVSGVNAGIYIKYGNTILADLESSDYSGTHSVEVSVDASGNSTVSIDGTLNPGMSQTGVDTSSALPIGLELDTAGAATGQIGALTMQSTATAPSNVDSVATASSLGSLTLSTITSALQDVGTMRANNGAEQSRLTFAASMLTANQTNLESAISSITDVDVAAETTNLAKWNVLVQAGTSMLTQANQSAETALKLITG